MVRKWEYKTFLRTRSFNDGKGDYLCSADGWNEAIDDVLDRLGQVGWELVAVSTRSGCLGGFKQVKDGSSIAMDYAGFTTEELWVFKRPV